MITDQDPLLQYSQLEVSSSAYFDFFSEICFWAFLTWFLPAGSPEAVQIKMELDVCLMFSFKVCIILVVDACVIHDSD